jgi:Subtilase family
MTNRKNLLRLAKIMFLAQVAVLLSFVQPNAVIKSAQAETATLKPLNTEATPKGSPESKLDSNLLIATRPPSAAAAPGKQFRATPPRDEQDRINLDIKANVSPELISAIQGLGGVIVFAPKDPRIHTMRVLLRPDKVTTLASRSDVFFIRYALQPVHNLASPEGDVAHNASLARSKYGVTGAYVKVGVISDSADDSFGSLNKAIKSQDMTNKLEILKFQAGSGEAEGLAMLEIVHAIAPGAELYFATDGGGSGSMAQNIRDLAAAGCRIIVDDVTYPDESPFQDGEIATAVADVSNQGVLYFSSAANNGNKASSTSSTYEGDFIAAGNAPSTWSSAAGAFSVRHPGTLMQFTDHYGTTTDKIILHPQSNQTTVSLFWNDPLANPNNPSQPAPNQYDLYAFDQNDQLIGFSDTTMGSTTDPLQIIELNTTVLGISHPSFVQGDYIRVVKATPSAPRYIHLDVLRVPFEDQRIATAGSTRGHNASTAENAFTVGAVAAPNPYASFATENPRPTVEPFSSDGPRRMFYAPDGTQYSPDLTQFGGRIFIKPDISAADRVTTTVWAMPTFSGSSAAAPHAAAIAALVLAYKPNLTPAQVRTILIDSAIPLDSCFNPTSGYGIPMADRALQLAGSAQFVLQNHFLQQGPKLLGSGASQLASIPGVSLSADGNTALLGFPGDDNAHGAARIFTRTGDTWAQQGDKLVGSGAVGPVRQGQAVALSADGNTAVIVGTGGGDNNNVGAAFVFTRSGTTWSPQGGNLVLANGSAAQGQAVAISADGSTIVIGNLYFNNYEGAAAVFTRNGTTWTQQGGNLVLAGASSKAARGSAVGISGDGNTILVAANMDGAHQAGAAWIFSRSSGIWSQQGGKLVGAGSDYAHQGQGAALSQDGNTAIVGAVDSCYGAAYVFTRNGTTWSQQGGNLSGLGLVGLPYQGSSVAISADGSTAVVSGRGDSGNTGTAWVFSRSGGVWIQLDGKLVGSGGVKRQGQAVSTSGDGSTILVGGEGGALVYAAPASTP